MKNEYDKIIDFLQRYGIDSHEARRELMDFYDEQMSKNFMEGYHKCLGQNKKKKTKKEK